MLKSWMNNTQGCLANQGGGKEPAEKQSLLHISEWTPESHFFLIPFHEAGGFIRRSATISWNSS